MRASTDLHPAVSRRTLLRTVLGAGVAALARVKLKAKPGPLVTPVEQIALEHASEPGRTTVRRYRAHAYIHLLAVPIFSRQDVGGGYALLDESAGVSDRFVGLEFAGGSMPDRAHGLNRVGFIQEAVVERAGRAASSGYYGFMVSSGEKSLDQARKSMSAQTGGTVPYSAAWGTGRPGRFECTLSHLPVPSRFNWSNFERLRTEMPERLAQPADKTRFDVALDSASSEPDTFLYSMRRAILNPARSGKREIVYNGKRYTLSTSKQADAKAGRDLVARGVLANGDRLWRLSGSITETGRRDASEFQVWFQDGDASGLPVRIEFYPKSFLKLVFEQDGRKDAPVMAGTTERSVRTAATDARGFR